MRHGGMLPSRRVANLIDFFDTVAGDFLSTVGRVPRGRSLMFGCVLADSIVRHFSAYLLPSSSLAHSVEFHLGTNLLHPSLSVIHPPQPLQCLGIAPRLRSRAFSQPPEAVLLSLFPNRESLSSYPSRITFQWLLRNVLPILSTSNLT